jgi:hypothetical protein
MLLALAEKAAPFSHAQTGDMPRLCVVEAEPDEPGRHTFRHHEGGERATMAMALRLRAAPSAIST